MNFHDGLILCRSLQNRLPDHLYSAYIGQKRFITQTKQHKSLTHHYDVLGLTRRATQQQIKAAYYKLSKEYHPDMNNSAGADKMFHEISEAYEILGKISSRREYDKQAFRSQNVASSHHFHDFKDFKPRSKTAPRGRTKMYDFDEYYKMHYGELRARRQREMEYEANVKKIREQMKRNAERREKGSELYAVFSLLTLLCGAILLTKRIR